MREQFKAYLIKEGYKEYTPSGLPSTVYDYIKRIDFICEEEGLLSWTQLASNINHYVINYDVGGRKESVGELSHRAVINALKRFRDFLYEIDYKSEFSRNVEPSRQERRSSILNRQFNPRYRGQNNNQDEKKYAGVGSTIVYRVLEDDEINQVTLVEPIHKKFENEVSKTSDLGEALLYSKEGEEVKVNSPEPYMIRVVHISNPITTVKNVTYSAPRNNRIKENYYDFPEDIFIPAASDNYANVKYEVSDGLVVGHIYGSAAKDIYYKGCEAFGWDRSKLNSFGPLQLLFSKKCTDEGYSIWFLPYSNLNNRKNPKANWRDLVSNDFTTIKENWNSIDERFHGDTDKRLTFVSQKNGQYLYLGIFQAKEIDEENKCKIFRRIDTNYGC